MFILMINPGMGPYYWMCRNATLNDSKFREHGSFSRHSGSAIHNKPAVLDERAKQQAKKRYFVVQYCVLHTKKQYTITYNNTTTLKHKDSPHFIILHTIT